MEIKVIKDYKIYDDFVSRSFYNHYMKLSSWAKLAINKTYIPHFLGFYENNNLIATCLILEKKNDFMYIPKGLCIDYTDIETLNKVLNLLIAYTKKSPYLRIDPNVIRCSRDINGNKIEGIDNEFITQALIKKGFKHKGYGYGYDGSLTNRFTLIKDISKDEVGANFAKSRINILKRHSQIGLKTRLGSLDDLKYLCEFEKELSSIHGFKPHSIYFFKDLLTTFETSRLYVTYIEIDTMIKYIQEELDSKKYDKDPEAKKSKENDLSQALSLKNKYGPIIVLACGLYLYNADYSWDLYTYNKKECGFLKPVDNLHKFAMLDMKSLGVKYYDMCGFSGSTDKNDAYYGLYAYKKSFGPDFIEMIGQFDYIHNKLKYKLNNFISKKLRIIKAKIKKIIYKN